MKILIDKREKQPLEFENSAKATLYTGDYTIEGLEDILCIERKSSIVEFYNNITEDRFWREIERMVNYPYKFLIFEFDFRDVVYFPEGTNLPKKVIEQLRVTPQYIISCITKIQVKYNIQVVFAGSREQSQKLMFSIMRRVNEATK